MSKNDKLSVIIKDFIILTHGSSCPVSPWNF